MGLELVRPSFRTPSSPLPCDPLFSLSPPLDTSVVIAIISYKLSFIDINSQADNRISTMELIIPPHTPGPPAHWHEMHDETFLVTKGTVRFYVPEAPGLEAKVCDAKAGDYVVVPTRAPHTFANETDDEARFINTFTPVCVQWAGKWRERLITLGILYSLFQVIEYADCRREGDDEGG
jgi:mannose-6-phosphate isomerase-like protein (cupin superfamily)